VEKFAKQFRGIEADFAASRAGRTGSLQSIGLLQQQADAIRQVVSEMQTAGLSQEKLARTDQAGERIGIPIQPDRGI